MPQVDCNPRCKPLYNVAVCLVCAVSAALTSCISSVAVTRVSLDALESAPMHRPRQRARTIVADVEKLEDLYHPLNSHVGIVQVRSLKDWQRLNRVAPQHAPPPDFSRGMIIGVLSRAGTPIDGGWPAVIESVRVFDTAGLLISHFQSGCYLPDATAYLESAYVEGLSTVLVVDVDDLRFYVR